LRPPAAPEIGRCPYRVYGNTATRGGAATVAPGLPDGDDAHMPHTIEAPTPPQEDPVRRWRREELERAGYPKTYAALLGNLEEIDLHVAVELVLKGCPLETALRILL